MSTEKRGWVSCKQRLPELGEIVILANNQPKVTPCVAKLEEDGDYLFWTQLWGGIRRPITKSSMFRYWMPLPPLPVEITIEPHDAVIRSSAV